MAQAAKVADKWLQASGRGLLRSLTDVGALLDADEPEDGAEQIVEVLHDLMEETARRLVEKAVLGVSKWKPGRMNHRANSWEASDGSRTISWEVEYPSSVSGQKAFFVQVKKLKKEFLSQFSRESWDTRASLGDAFDRREVQSFMAQKWGSVVEDALTMRLRDPADKAQDAAYDFVDVDTEEQHWDDDAEEWEEQMVVTEVRVALVLGDPEIRATEVTSQGGRFLVRVELEYPVRLHQTMLPWDRSFDTYY